MGRLPCFCRSFLWWLGFLCFQTPGYIVAVTLLACCAWAGTPLLGIFGDKQMEKRKHETTGATPDKPDKKAQRANLPQRGDLPPFSSDAEENEQLRECLAVEKKRTENLRSHLTSEGYLEADIEAVQDTGAQTKFEPGRIAREAKWMKKVADWLETHGLDRLRRWRTGRLPSVYLLLFRKKSDSMFQDRRVPAQVLCSEGYEWRMYIGAEERDPRKYRQILSEHKWGRGPPLEEDDPAPACVSAWCIREQFHFHGELTLEGCPEGFEDALTLLLSVAFERMETGKGDWVRSAPWNLRGCTGWLMV